MDSKLKHIVETSDLLTQAEIQKYSSKSGLSKEECYRIELKITNNPINQELLDAYQNHPNLFKEFKSIKNPLNDYGVEWFLLFTSLIWISIMAFFAFNHKSIPITEDIAIQNTEIIAQKFERNNNSDVIEGTPVKAEQNINPKDLSQIKHEILEVETLDTRVITQIENAAIDNRELVNHKKYPAIYLGDFKTTDYSKIRPSSVKTQMKLSGTSANKENDSTIVESQSISKEAQSYKDFLRETLGGFKNKKYALIIQPLSQLLDNYPDDDNALFYRGLSYYHLDKTELSIQDLNAVLSNYLSNFKEEAKWYLALNYQKSGQNKLYRSTLEDIIKQKGFYAKEAQKLYILCKK